MDSRKMKKCNKCGELKELSEFSKNKCKKDGYQTQCKDCSTQYRKENRERILAKKKEYRKNNKEKIRQDINNWKRNNKERVAVLSKRYQDKHKEIISQKAKMYREKNIDKVNETRRNWKINNKDKVCADAAKRRAAKIHATPSWSEEDKIKIIYEKAKWLEKLTGIKYHVDHIVPLRGRNVCGLHVWQNLQILEDKINAKKSNKNVLTKKKK